MKQGGFWADFLSSEAMRRGAWGHVVCRKRTLAAAPPPKHPRVLDVRLEVAVLKGDRLDKGKGLEMDASHCRVRHEAVHGRVDGQSLLELPGARLAEDISVQAPEIPRPEQQVLPLLRLLLSLLLLFLLLVLLLLLLLPLPLLFILQ